MKQSEEVQKINHYRRIFAFQEYHIFEQEHTMLYNVIDFVRMWKSTVESCVDKTFSDRLSFFERCGSSLLCLLMALPRTLLGNDKASLLETFGSLKIRNFGYTPSCLQLLRKLISNFSLFFMYSSFSYFRKSLTVTFPYFCAISLQIFITFLDSTKRKIVWIKITAFFKHF